MAAVPISVREGPPFDQFEAQEGPAGGYSPRDVNGADVGVIQGGGGDGPPPKTSASDTGSRHSSGRNFTATSRSRLSWLALYTTPIPPRPEGFSKDLVARQPCGYRVSAAGSPPRPFRVSPRVPRHRRVRHSSGVRSSGRQTLRETREIVRLKASSGSCTRRPRSKLGGDHLEGGLRGRSPAPDSGNRYSSTRTTSPAHSRSSRSTWTSSIKERGAEATPTARQEGATPAAGSPRQALLEPLDGVSHRPTTPPASRPDRLECAERMWVTLLFPGSSSPSKRPNIWKISQPLATRYG